MPPKGGIASRGHRGRQSPADKTGTKYKRSAVFFRKKTERGKYMFLDEIRNELENHIVPYWAELKDEEFGGFYGYKSFDLVLDKKADKGVILHSRILWFFSSCVKVLGGEKYRELADHAFDYVKKYCIDYELGGVYWMTTYDGKPADDMKHTYNIAFAVYALSAYYNATGVKEALESIIGSASRTAFEKNANFSTSS